MNILDFFFPKFCLNCKKPGHYICSECLSKVEKANPICIVCKRFSPKGQTHLSCRNNSYLDSFFAAYCYQGVIRKAILALKYRFAYDISKEIAVLFFANFALLLPKTALLVPIPLHPKREHWRGFNQADILARQIAKLGNWQYKKDLLMRTLNNPQQARLTKKERLRNTCGIFAVNDEALRVILSEAEGSSSRIILFDDVCTTGATLNEAAKALKKAGVKRVWGMSIAR